MKLIIAGGRDFDDYELLKTKVTAIRTPITEIVCGEAKGADALGKRWAIENGIAVKSFYADWTTHGKKAGILRNIEMGNYAQAAVIFWDGSSRGSKHMLEYMKSLGKPVIVISF